MSNKAPEFRRVSRGEMHVMIGQSRIIAVFSQVGDAFGLMVDGDQFLTREEKTALIQAARALPTRD